VVGVDVVLKISGPGRQVEDFLARVRAYREVKIEVVGFIGIGGESALGLVAARAIGRDVDGVVLGLRGGESRVKVIVAGACACE